MYLKDRSPYLDSSFLYNESQNIIRVNLLGTYSTVNTPLRRVCLYYIMDLIKQVSQLLRAELKELVDIVRAIIELIELCDEEW